MKRSIIKSVAKTAKVKGPKFSVKFGSPDKIQGKIGTYTKSNKFSSITGRRTIDGMTRRQAYKLEKGLQNLNKMAISSKPELIKAAGQALAMNTTGAQGGLALGIANSMKPASPTPTGSSSINNLIGGGANIAGKDNEDEEETGGNSDFSFLR